MFSFEFKEIFKSTFFFMEDLQWLLLDKKCFLELSFLKMDSFTFSKIDKRRYCIRLDGHLFSAVATNSWLEEVCVCVSVCVCVCVCGGGGAGS